MFVRIQRYTGNSSWHDNAPLTRKNTVIWFNGELPPWVGKIIFSMSGDLDVYQYPMNCLMSSKSPNFLAYHILRAQEAVKDSRICDHFHAIQSARYVYSCLDNNETTLWSKHNQWPELFHDRPLDIITTTVRQPQWYYSRDYIIEH